MGCSHSKQCICNLVRQIEEAQFEKTSHHGDCDEKPTNNLNTIPFMLISNGTCDFFIGKGIFSHNEGKSLESFKTPFFRVDKFIDDRDCCVQLELLQAQTEEGTASPVIKDDDICSFLSSHSIGKFIRTGICITVDLSCYCGIECLTPVFAKYENPVPSRSCKETIKEELCGLFGTGNVTVWKAALPGAYLEATFEIFNDGSSLGNVDAVIKAQQDVIFPTLSPDTTVSREAIMPSSFTILAPPGTSGRYCITLLRCVPF
ncbi:CotY/CotZ family spore coat protein [Schinkia azotoformans]|uniref:CotY/CotZ family spore coat protein n=1 Tax=Schinkia azotoformans TaxID=1454 RepID=UPI002DBAE5B5|nr:CotY/CotZ family spore coat protein [Schinkia azotoformans]MEC1694110.1 CotY/CotZ family spore coat protein [Schinkia azotoformans]MEC1715822.1 CotY/CotZ family spore coat protein [Schinkia azotoformans]MEC1724885.1 CotY/CotZ family spore coat protein [Schinkia azotoformans]MEC1741461.1 CotY/CotZ family spore coat protein [Schinkia azotoformans]MEC1744455.1 CotY/CotZ family spore coat protein [Schinkia azotoformans]